MSKVYQLVNEQILEELERGVVPWRQPWKVDGLEPRNLVRDTPYRGVNVFLLGMRHASTAYWLTFRQAKELGGSIRRGEKHTKVVFWKWLPKLDLETGEQLVDERGRPIVMPILRYYRVFNLDQTEGIPMPERPEAEAETPRHLPAEEIAAGYADGPRVVHGPQAKACYVPSHDEVLMPPRDAFEGEVGYYGTLFHELVHSTGMPRRLDRPAFLGNHAAPMGSKRYAREELVAELGSVYLAGEAGLDPDVPNSAAYIAHWQRALRRDPRLLVTAAQQAQRAADWILGRRPAAGAGGEGEAEGKSDG